ncbi:MAG: chemotaxis-specific protein-glutamate methyltransferase CheB [Longimicrobiales bacterium]|nr:chemotaxis-specific protein-glutamate methyltransferase CheB [Longimicrobiales bacterium]
MIRVLIVEDSTTVRRLLRHILESDPEIEVVGEAADGAEAVRMAESLRPDLITMDIHMPRVDGLEATKQIMVRVPTPIVIVSTSTKGGEVSRSFDAIQAGAVALLDKPVDPAADGFDTLARELVDTVRSLADMKVVRRWGPALEARVTVPEKGQGWLVGIAASTGGPAALSVVLGDLPPGLSAPVLVVQHIAAGFTEGLASWLAGRCPLPVTIAQSGAKAEPGVVYIAGDDAHLGIDGKGRIALCGSDPVGGHRPSANHLFRSMADAWAGATLAVVLTGMGSDGLEGLRVLKKKGGTILVQNKETSVVYGMNREVERAGLADAALPLDRIADRIAKVVEA